MPVIKTKSESQLLLHSVCRGTPRLWVPEPPVTATLAFHCTPHLEPSGQLHAMQHTSMQNHTFSTPGCPATGALLNWSGWSFGGLGLGPNEMRVFPFGDW